MNIDAIHANIKARELVEKDEFNRKAIDGYEDRPNLKKFSFFMYRDVKSSKVIGFRDKSVVFRDNATGDTQDGLLNFLDSYYVMFLGMVDNKLIFVDSDNSIAFHVPKRLLKKFINELLLKSNVNLLSMSRPFYEERVDKMDVSTYRHFTLTENDEKSVIEKKETI